jgi:hypothetical protein
MLHHGVLPGRTASPENTEVHGENREKNEEGRNTGTNTKQKKYRDRDSFTSFFSCFPAFLIRNFSPCSLDWPCSLGALRGEVLLDSL